MGIAIVVLSVVVFLAGVFVGIAALTGFRREPRSVSQGIRDTLKTRQDELLMYCKHDALCILAGEKTVDAMMGMPEFAVSRRQVKSTLVLRVGGGVEYIGRFWDIPVYKLPLDVEYLSLDEYGVAIELAKEAIQPFSVK
jgi:hypothetical protein